MLKEVYVMKDGSPIFHYTKESSQDEMHYILSSGFLSAIQSFAQETRSSEIDFFASKDEFFIFDQIKSGHNIVAIFTNSMEQQLGRMVMSQIVEEIGFSVIPELGLAEAPSPVEARKLGEKIEDIANKLISIDYQAEAAQTVFLDVPELILLVLYDYRRDEVYFKAEEKKGIFDEDQLKGLRSIHRYMMKLVKTLDLGDEYKIITIEYNRDVLVLAKYRTKQTLCLAKDVTDITEIAAIPFRLMSLPDYDRYMVRYHALQLQSRWRIDQYEEARTLIGKIPNSSEKEELLNTVSAVERMLETVNMENFGMINIYTAEPQLKRLSISKNFTLQEINVEIYS